MSFGLVLYGHDVVHTPNDKHPEALAFSANAGGLMPLRQPVSMRPIFDKLASGNPVAFNESERTQIASLGIVLDDATNEARESEAWRLHAAGVPVPEINARRTAPHYRPNKPVKITGSFIPTKVKY